MTMMIVIPVKEVFSPDPYIDDQLYQRRKPDEHSGRIQTIAVIYISRVKSEYLSKCNSKAGFPEEARH